MFMGESSAGPLTTVAPGQVGTRRVDEHAVSHRRPAEQHAKAHIVA
jgi:hypothetical protein